MSDQNPTVVLLAPDIFGTGGIQRAARTMIGALAYRYGASNVAVVSAWAGDRSGFPEGVVINAGGWKGPGTGRLPLVAKASFAFTAVATARRLRRRRLLLVAVHPHLAGVTRVAAFVAGVPFVVWSMGRESWALPSGARRAMRHAAAIPAISQYTADRVVAQLPTSPVELVHLGLDRSFGRVLAEPVRDAMDPGLVLAVSRLVPGQAYKGVDTLLAAWPTVVAKVPTAKLVIVGDGPDAARLKALARSEGVASSVVFAGRVGDQDLLPLYERASVFALPGRASLDARPEGEGFGLVFIEAAAAGLPVVAGRAAGAVDAVIDRETGLLVAPGDPLAAAEAILELLEDPALAARLGSAGKARVAAQFGFEAFSDRLGVLVERVLCQTGR